jgi:hypothetical protein
VICFILRGERTCWALRENAATRIMFHTRIMPVGSPARRLADMSSRIYGEQADPVISLL